MDEIAAELSHIRGSNERPWLWDDKLIRVLNRVKILKNPCERCLIETICAEVCEQCDLYNSRCNVIRRNLFDTVEGVKMILCVILCSGGYALLFYYLP